MSNIYNYGLYKPAKLYKFTDKDQCLNNYVRYMLNRTQEIFRYENLPETINKRSLELLNQINGFSIWAKYNDELYVFNGGLGGVPDVYYQPTKAIVANPALNMSKEYDIDKDCVVMRNDSLMCGLLPLLTRYCSQLLEADISLNLASINSRIISLISAGDDATKASAEKYIKDILDGKLGIIGENAFLENGIKAQPYGSNTNANIISLLELHKRTYANLWNELGVRDNGEGKRESLASEEVTASDGILLPLLDNMLEERKIAIDKINEMFGTNITVSLSSAWEDLEEEIEAEQELIEAEVEATEEPEEETQDEQDTEDEDVKEGVTEDEET